MGAEYFRTLVVSVVSVKRKQASKQSKTEAVNVVPKTARFDR